MRIFNTTGPVVPSKHYCIPPLSRIDLAEVLLLIQLEQYFVFHAPRQSGKTSILKDLRDHLNASGKYRCVYVNFEPAKVSGEDRGAAMRTLLGKLGSMAIDTLQDSFVARAKIEVLDEFGPDGALEEILGRWAKADAKPLVLLIDEVDSLVGDTLISVLTQLRSGFDRRPARFPQSVVLCGMRDLRDYRFRSSDGHLSPRGGSPFNIVAESLRLVDFSKSEIETLLAQHSAETGQQFEPRAIERIWELTCGQPWLVNALSLQACFKDESGRDRCKPIRVAAIEKAKETLIAKRVTHIEQLTDKLNEGRVRRVILPMLAGSSDWEYSMRDLEYVRDLGLVAHQGQVRAANPIYAEVIPREFTAALQSGLESKVSSSWYWNSDGSLDIAALLEAFQGYFRENSEWWVNRFGHQEAGPQLVLHAFLQRVVNSGGRIFREYAVGRGRTDLLIEWPCVRARSPARTHKYVIECKVLRAKNSLESLIREGCKQTAEYMDKSGAESGHLVVFDMRPGKSWDERVFRRRPKAGRCPVSVWGM